MTETQNNNPNSGKLDNKQLVGLAFEMGFVIALPVLAFSLAGKWLDGRYGTDNLFTLLGIALALATTTLWLYRKIKAYIK